MGSTPSPDRPMTAPSAQRPSAPGRKPRLGNVLARVIPARAAGCRSSTPRIAVTMGWIAVTAPVSLKSFGTRGSPPSRIQPMIRAVSAAFCETMSPWVPSPPWGQERLYSIPMAPAASSLRVLDCHTARSAASSPVTGPPVDAIVRRSGYSRTSRATSSQTRSSEWPDTLSQLP